ncbi:transcriptional regulator [Streptomyces daqingensis]|uniref:Transcriptional regulator n=1 Tax=Streptomyces daqingensis TaxID=1472640 RepID=A0ABQ2M172_9ACTN|nr:GAF domain-containing protein [Streptomyces daqingensis]GGO45636.1 transcriptional regulator [Streptomyces daqingensis]
MLNPWLALEAGADAAERAGQVRRAHEEFVTGGGIGALVRGVVAESWQRCAGASVEPESVAGIDLADGELEAYRAAHPLARVMPLFRELLGTVADDGAHLLSVCDENGRMLWVEGHAQVRRHAERMNFVPGARWSERYVGTNAPGTALAVDHAVQIFASEHYCRPVQAWTCAAAPVHDPRTHRLVGAVDITGGDHLASPQSLALVQATARAAEAVLGELGGGPGASAPAGPVLNVLGCDEALFDAGAGRSGSSDRAGGTAGTGAPLRLGRRHSEIMMLLAAHPEGLTGERLALELYGERDVNPVTLRAELSRLRGLLGPLLDSRPYRLRRRPHTDYDAVGDALSAGDPRAALAAYRGPLLPLSEAPGVVRLRRLLEDRLRRALLRRPDAVLLEEWVRTPWGEDDLEAWEALLTCRGAGETRRLALASRVRELRLSYGLEESAGGGGDRPGRYAAGREAHATYPQRSRP